MDLISNRGRRFAARTLREKTKEMMMTNMKMLRAAVIAVALSIPMAATTSAQPPVVIGGGLVTVQITDVLNDNTVTVQDINVNVGVALQLAATLCDTSVNLLSQELKGGSTTCSTAIEDGIRTVTINK